MINESGSLATSFASSMWPIFITCYLPVVFLGIVGVDYVAVFVDYSVVVGVGVVAVVVAAVVVVGVDFA